MSAVNRQRLLFTKRLNAARENNTYQDMGHGSFAPSPVLIKLSKWHENAKRATN